MYIQVLGSAAGGGFPQWNCNCPNCDGLRRAVCSPHRTGTAVDLYVGQAPGLGVDSTTPASREYMARSATYRWLVTNAGRFGFVPYVYEPWHWEYVKPWDPSFAP